MRYRMVWVVIAHIANHLLGGVNVLQTVRRAIRPAVLALLRALPSPDGCGCRSRKEWMIRQIEAI
jgi:hypothetical protein